MGKSIDELRREGDALKREGVQLRKKLVEWRRAEALNYWMWRVPLEVAQKQVANEMDRLVLRMVQAGATYRFIGERLGVSASRAQQRARKASWKAMRRVPCPVEGYFNELGDIKKLSAGIPRRERQMWAALRGGQVLAELVEASLWQVPADSPNGAGEVMGEETDLSKITFTEDEIETIRKVLFDWGFEYNLAADGIKVRALVEKIGVFEYVKKS